MTLSKLKCKSCGRVWYEQFVGKPLTEVAMLMMSTQCPTNGCDGDVMYQFARVEVTP